MDEKHLNIWSSNDHCGMRQKKKKKRVLRSWRKSTHTHTSQRVGIVWRYIWAWEEDDALVCVCVWEKELIVRCNFNRREGSYYTILCVDPNTHLTSHEPTKFDDPYSHEGSVPNDSDVHSFDTLLLLLLSALDHLSHQDSLRQVINELSLGADAGYGGITAHSFPLASVACCNTGCCSGSHYCALTI